MRVMVLLILVFFFVVMPMYALNSLVMPGLDSLKQTYANADKTANAVAQLPVTTP